jgi:putative acetyltransferase
VFRNVLAVVTLTIASWPSYLLAASVECQLIAQGPGSYPTFRSRPAMSADIKILQPMINRIRGEFIHQGETLNDTFDADLIDINQTYDQQDSQLQVITDLNGTIVGSGGFFRTSAESAEIRKIYFDKGIRGLQLAEPWLKFLIENAKETGVKRLWLINHKKLSVATKLYLKLGFQHFEPDESEYSEPTSDYHYLELWL